MASSMQSPLGKARGLGSARSGVSHWWLQRLTAMGMIPLVLYSVGGLVENAGADYETARQWLAQPFNATSLLLLLGVGFFMPAWACKSLLKTTYQVKQPVFYRWLPVNW